MSEPTLVILAAGLASRYGGLKQVDPVGTNGESLIDFSIYDAYLAGFRKLVLIIRREHEELFEQQIGDNVRPFMEVSYAYQSTKDLPDGYLCPKTRVKPWGTAQALLVTKPYIDGPFMIINSDDYYGREAFEKMFKFLNNDVTDDCFGMVAYKLGNTLSDYGTVNRGVCEIENGYLSSLNEVNKVVKRDGKPFKVEADGNETELTDGLSSMNFWGFTTAIYPYMEKQFESYLNESIEDVNSELVLSTAMSNIIKNHDVKVKVLGISDQWLGVSYPSDKDKVKRKLEELKNEDYYPFDLWD